MWEPLPAMATTRGNHAAVRWRGGCAVGGCVYPDGTSPPDELFDEESGRWVDMPGTMVLPRTGANALILPMAVLHTPAPTPAAGLQVCVK